MRLLGFDITRAGVEKALRPADDRGAWRSIIKEPFAGAWQKNAEVKLDTSLTYSAIFRCIGIISSDVAKMRLRLMWRDKDGIWEETSRDNISPVLKKPNRYQNRIQFISNWMESKLVHGNAYILKERDANRNAIALYVLDPSRVTPLVSDEGAVFYRLKQDRLAGVDDTEINVPASEIIHDRFNTLFHPLVGLSPIYACGLAAAQGLRIQNNSATFFANGSAPGGVLTAPGTIDDATAQRLKEHWDSSFTGENYGKVAVLGDGLTFQPMAVKAVDAQLVEQLKWSAETVCSVFGVPAYKIGVGAAPSYNNVEAMDAQYYAQCLQIHIESIEIAMDEGLDLPSPLGTYFDLDDLLRMDTATMVEAEAKAVGAGVKSPNESRRRMGLKPTKGGETPYLQQQNYSLAALADRDSENPLAAPPAEPAMPVEEARALIDEFSKGFANA